MKTSSAISRAAALLLAPVMTVSSLFAFPALAQLPTGSSIGPQLAIGHRGASGYAPEHTFFAYDLAVEMDVDMLECDAVLSADGVVVCMHDTSVERTTGGQHTGRVDSYTLAQLREMDFGSWYNVANPQSAKPEYAGARIVPFEEQLDCYLRLNPRLRFHVETKGADGFEGRLEDAIVALLSRKGLLKTGNGHVQTSTIVIQSFYASSLERIKLLAPSLPTAFLFSAPTDQQTAQWVAEGSTPGYIDAMAPTSFALLLDPTMTQRFHMSGMDVHTWTVDDRQQMDLLLDQGVDGIFTNLPDVLREAVDAHGSGTTPEHRGNPESFPRGCPGVAGRVTSADGPGDIWAADSDGEGVHMAIPYASARAGYAAGALGCSLIALLGCALRNRFRSSGSRPSKQVE